MANGHNSRPPDDPKAGLWLALSWLVVVGFAVTIVVLVTVEWP